MAYNNGFPISYQPAQIVYPTPPQTNQQQNTSIVWVQGEAGAKAYPVAAGNSVMLLDSEKSVFYIKSTDASGMPMPLRTFDFTERTAPAVSNEPKFNPNDYVSRKEFEELKSSLNFRRKEKNNNGKSVE